MLVIAIVTLLSLALAGLVLFYVAFPHRGETPPAPAEWLGDVLGKAVEAVPTIDPDEHRGAGVGSPSGAERRRAS